MKRILKLPLLLCLCLMAALSLAMPASAAIETVRKHNPPTTNEIDAIYAIDQDYQTYHRIATADWERVRKAVSLSTTPSQSENKNSKYVGGFCFVMRDGSQRIYTVTENQVLVGNTPLFASVTERAAAANLSRQLCSDYPARVAMLAYMNPDKISRVTFSGYGATGRKIDPKKQIELDITRAANPGAVQEFADEMKRLDVTARDTQIITGHTDFEQTDDNMTATIEFSTGTVYHMEILDGEMSIWSSDGTRTYTYSFPDYDPRRAGIGTGFSLRTTMWELFRDSNNYESAVIFLTKPVTGERTRGAFYSAEDGGLSTMARLGQILDDIRTTKPLTKIYPSEKPFLEIYAQGDGKAERFELDGDMLTGYYTDSDGYGVSVPINADDYAWVKSLLNGRERSNRTMLLEYDGGDSPAALVTCSSRDPLLGTLFDAKEKDSSYPAYTTGREPSYAKKGGITCWADTGSLTATTVYPGGVMVQQSNLRPWTPAKYDAQADYQDLRRMIRYPGERAVEPIAD